MPLVLIIIARKLKWYEIYTVPTTSMDPNYKVGSYVFASSIPSTRKGDVVAYLAEPLPFDKTDKPYEVLCRIVAEEGDVLQIKNGLLYVNQKLADDTLMLSYFFIISSSYWSSPLIKKEITTEIYPLSDTTILINCSYPQIQKLKLQDNCQRYIDTVSNRIQPELFTESINKKWTNDNFGPVKIPKDCFFLMGDNRSNSADSRYRGFIKRDKVTARALN